jgi:GNAT superfamily N-acetyltransferase
MNDLVIHKREISREDFKLYLKNQKSDIKWFWWYIVSDISAYSCFEILNSNVRVGVFCVERCEAPHIDIYIGREHRGRGLGFKIIRLLKSECPSARFKVNNRNHNSKEFFDKLVESQMIFLADRTPQFIIYRYVYLKCFESRFIPQ